MSTTLCQRDKRSWSTLTCCCCLLIVVVLVLHASSTASGCGVNFDKMRKRRIEAIRGQILSKLGLTHLPTDEQPPPDSMTVEIEAMYNRTRDFVLEQARQKREECLEPEDNYYAQDITTVYMKNPTQAASSIPGSTAPRYKYQKSQQGVSEFFDFDLTQTELDPDTIVSASLRVYQVPSTADGTREQVELYHLSSPQKDGQSPTKSFLHMQLMDTANEGWITFDVTSSVRQWIQFPNLNQGLELTVPCSNDEPPSTMKRAANRGITRKLDVMFAGSTKISKSRGDSDAGAAVEQEFGKEFNPHLIIMVRTPTPEAPQGSSRRRKRALDADFCFRRKASDTNCCLRELYIDFRKDLGWNWVHAPTGYKANFCGGACPYMWSTDTQYATILTLYKSMNPQASSAPCCTAKDLDPLTIMYYKNGSYKFINMSDMVLLSCKCS